MLRARNCESSRKVLLLVNFHTCSFPSPTDKILSPVTKLLEGGFRKKFTLGARNATMGAGAAGGAGTASAMARRAIKGSFLSASKAKPTAPRVVEAPGAVTAHREEPESGPDASVVAGIRSLSVEGGGAAAPAPTAASASSAAPLLSNKVVSFGGSSLAAAAPAPMPAAAAARSGSAGAASLSSAVAVSAPVRQNFGAFGSTVEMSSTPTGASAREDVVGGAAAEACAPGAAGEMEADADSEPAFPTPVKALSFATTDRENAPMPSPTSGKVVSAMPHGSTGGLGLKSPAFAAGSKREPLSPTRPSNSFGRR
jgi:hypothetical protein